MKEDKWGSNAKRRAELRKLGWKPSAGLTLLTRLAHWISPGDGTDWIEADALKRARLVAVRKGPVTP